MPNITIDGQKYDTESFSNEAKAQLISLQMIDGKIADQTVRSDTMEIGEEIGGWLSDWDREYSDEDLTISIADMVPVLFLTG